ncbi:unnamed protein product, partial [Didymodactylos carnosus]
STRSGIVDEQQQITTASKSSTTDTITHNNNLSSLPASNSSSQIQYAKMRIIASPIFHMKDVVRALITSLPKSGELIETLINYVDALGATRIHAYLVDKT